MRACEPKYCPQALLASDRLTSSNSFTTLPCLPACCVRAALTSLRDLSYVAYEEEYGRRGDKADADLLTIASSLKQLTSLNFPNHACGPAAFLALLQLPQLQKLCLLHVADLAQSYADVACPLTDIELTTTNGVDMVDLAFLPSCARLELQALDFDCRGGAADVEEAAEAFERSRSVRGISYRDAWEDDVDDALNVTFSAWGAGARMLRALRLLEHRGFEIATFSLRGFGELICIWVWNHAVGLL